MDDAVIAPQIFQDQLSKTCLIYCYSMEAITIHWLDSFLQLSLTFWLHGQSKKNRSIEGWRIHYGMVDKS